MRAKSCQFPRRGQGAAIFRAQVKRESEIWFIEHSDAREVLYSCSTQDPDGVWRELTSYLESETAYHFVIGFPPGILDLLPEKEIQAWIAQKPGERAPIVMRLVRKDLSRDDTLAARLLERFGAEEKVSSIFFAEYTSGGWMGPASGHWNGLAEGLGGVSKRTRLKEVRRWAIWAAKELKKMADQAREEEEEQRLNWR
jgi:hypothetical protein